MSVVPPAGTISFARGVPSPDMFPFERLAEAARRAVDRHGRAALNYGPPGGFGPLREWIAVRHGVRPEQVLVTPGSMIALRFLVEHLLGDGGHAVVEAPTYDRMLHLLRGAGAEVDAVEPERLEEALGSRPRLLYVMPTFHNPTGRTLSLARREALADAIVEHGTTVVEDDPYGLLRLDGDAPPHLHRLLVERGACEQAILLSSFSKSIAPGLRVGYVVLPERLVSAIEAIATATYVSPPLFAQAQVFEFLDARWLEPQLEDARAFLRPRRDALLEVLQAELGGRATWTRPEGGYFLWLDLLGSDAEAENVARRARAAGVAVVPGTGFFAGAGGEQSLRLSFSHPSVEEIREGARRLAAVI